MKVKHAKCRELWKQRNVIIKLVYFLLDIPVSRLACHILYCYFTETFSSSVCGSLPHSSQKQSQIILNTFLTQVPPAVLLTFGIKPNPQTSQRKTELIRPVCSCLPCPISQLYPYIHSLSSSDRWRVNQTYPYST